jgi:CRISPR-associated exonuclease Cas4
MSVHLFTEDSLLPLSGVQHYVYCPRRAALVHIEGIWEENTATAKGRVSHDRAHEPVTESRGPVRIARGLLLRSLELGLTGKADVVEFHRVSECDPDAEALRSPSDVLVLDGVPGWWRPFPVEHKSGKLRHERTFEVQLCAQAMCLEEMLDVYLSEGAVYYGSTGLRALVSFDDSLRKETREAAAGFHGLVTSGRTPPASYSAKCDACSLHPVCMPKVVRADRSVSTYLKRAFS